MDWRDHITVDPAVCHGKACVKGTRVMASVILDNLAAGETPEAIASAYHVEPEDIRAALLYAGVSDDKVSCRRAGQSHSSKNEYNEKSK